MMQPIAFALIALGILIPLGYGAKAFFTSPLIPLPFRLAIGAVVAGLLLLLISVTWERLKASKGEKFKEVEK